MKGKILVTDTIHPLFIEEMTKLGYEVDYEPDIRQEEVVKKIPGYLGLVINSKTTADRELMDRGKALKFIGRMGSGMEIIDLDHAAKKGITCINSPEGNRMAVAEHALAMILCLLNNIHIANNQVREYKWIREINRGHELSSRIIGIIGFGNTGSAFAQVLKGFGVQVLAYDKYKSNYGNKYVRECELSEIFNQADVVSLHLPFTVETENMVTTDFIGQFSKSIYLINTSRGKIVKTEDLLSAIDSGKVSGAALDVLENENLAGLSADQQKCFNKLIQSEKVILTPHIAGWTYESRQKIAISLATKIKKVLT